jgi:RecB family exonuclease
MAYSRVFPTSAALQEYLLQEAAPGTLIVVPQARLARQVWAKQRDRELNQGRTAWEPLNLVTLNNWWGELFKNLWPEVALASYLTRVALWRRAVADGPALDGVTASLEWAQALDEAHSLLVRHRLPLDSPARDALPLVAWRRQITRIYEGLLEESGLLPPARIPDFLLEALAAGRLHLPQNIILVGFKNPAPAEAAWLTASAGRARLLRLEIKGNPEAVGQALVFNDRAQEMEWVAAQLVESFHQQGLPWHRLAVTSPVMEDYAPPFRRVLAELLGPPGGEAGWYYNFSKGPYLAETPLFQAALLPLRLAGRGERREDLVDLWLSPYYKFRRQYLGRIGRFDRHFREKRLDRGWKGLKAAARTALAGEAAPGLVDPVDQALNRLKGTYPATELAGRLREAWTGLGFPQGLDEAEEGLQARISALLGEVEAVWGGEVMGAGELAAGLEHGARRQIIPGPGVQEAGVQVMGLLEMRGLDFDRVFCLGLNSGSFPPPPRVLPLLSPSERRGLLGGTHASQHRLAAEAYGELLAASPCLTLTRPRRVNEEEQVPTPFYQGKWLQPGEEGAPEAIAPLSRPQAAWMMAPAVKAAFTALPPEAPAPPPEPPVSLAPPDNLSITRVALGLECPCRFLLEVLLQLEALPEVDPGLAPRERGELLHKILARFTTEFKEILDRGETWDQARARELLKAAARCLFAAAAPDLHWQAEWERLLGEEEAAPGLLWRWLEKERERYEAGWRWRGMEVGFKDLTGPGCSFSLKGRIDRLDVHEPSGDLLIWDYKTGDIPAAKKVFDTGEELQLPGYLLAVRRGRVGEVSAEAGCKAGFIGLKSVREKHLKHEDFPNKTAQWDRVVEDWLARVRELGRRLAAGDFAAAPRPAPGGRERGACRYCAFNLVCGFVPEAAPEEDEEEE